MIRYLAELNEEERTRVIREAFALVAKTNEGQIVFGVILEQLYLFRPCQNDEHRVLANYGKFLLHYFGEDVQLRMLEAIVPQRTPSVQGEKNGD